MIAFNQSRPLTMNTPANKGRNALATGVWTLWIDCVGGFRLLEGERLSVGGLGGDNPADIAVRSTWRSRVATLTRQGDDYWISPVSHGLYAEDHESASRTSDDETSVPLKYGEVISSGSLQSGDDHQPRLRVHKPSPLSRSAIATLDPPHRFATSADAFVLFDKLILIGPDRSHHIRTLMAPETLIVMKKDDQWTIRPKNGAAIPLHDGVRTEVGELVMVLRSELGSTGESR